MPLICPTLQAKRLRHVNATGKSLEARKSCQVKSNCLISCPGRGEAPPLASILACTPFAFG
jgi:hypothetical protein